MLIHAALRAPRAPEASGTSEIRTLSALVADCYGVPVEVINLPAANFFASLDQSIFGGRGPQWIPTFHGSAVF